MFNPKRVILHCSASGDYTPDNKAFDLIGAADIHVWHTEGRKKKGLKPFKMIGYHLVVRRTGRIESGRSLAMQGAHCAGENFDSIGICWIGTYEPTQEQLESLKQIYLELKARFGITYDQWFGHRQFDKKGKECPGFSIELIRALFKEIDQTS